MATQILFESISNREDEEMEEEDAYDEIDEEEDEYTMNSKEAKKIGKNHYKHSDQFRDVFIV